MVFKIFVNNYKDFFFVIFFVLVINVNLWLFKCKIIIII